MPVHVIALTRLNLDAENALEKYLNVAGPLMDSLGAKVLSRYELAESIVGTSDIQFVTLVEYPDKTAVTKVFHSQEYQSLEKVKKLAFANYQVNIVAVT